MDPWLEHPALWPDVRQRVITYGSDQLQSAVGDRYVVVIGESVLLESSGRSLYPDVAILDRSPDRPQAAAGPHADPPVVVLVEPVEYREVFLEVRDTHGGDRVVTVIEVLSPSNKHPGEARDGYLKKQRELIESQVHLVEIDLLRTGRRTVALPADLFAGVPYLAVVCRAEDPRRREVYPVGFRDRLPLVPVPLASPDADVVLDLGRVLAETYARGAFHRRIDYHRDPEPPLGPYDAASARERVAARPRS